MRRYIGFCEGAVDVAMTRVDRSKILSGFVQDASVQRVVQDPVPSQAEVDELARQIRTGRRPGLYVHETTRADYPTYTCPDDLPTLAAYTSLGIAEVPVLIMDPTSQTKHAQLLFRGLTSPQGPAFVFTDSKPGQSVFDSRPALLGHTVQETLQACQNALEGSLGRLRAFHSSGGTTHYHNCVASYLVRAIRVIAAIQPVLEHGIGEAAVILSRTIYELSACYYLDWLAPETVGDAMKLSAQASGVDLRPVLDQVESSRVEAGWTRDSAKDMSRGLRKQLELIGSVAKKVRLTPMRDVHASLYRRLSRITHQDASATAAFSGFLDPGVTPCDVDMESLQKDGSLACSTIAMAAQVLSECSTNDIGVSS
jgi:hypothetical protein